MNIILVLIGVYFIIFSFIVSGKNTRSKFVFQVIPFFCGLFCIFYAVLNMGILNINL